jgi:hypothetical protein
MDMGVEDIDGSEDYGIKPHESYLTPFVYICMRLTPPSHTSGNDGGTSESPCGIAIGIPALDAIDHRFYMLGAAVPSDHLPTVTISTLTGSGAP